MHAHLKKTQVVLDGRMNWLHFWFAQQLWTGIHQVISFVEERENHSVPNPENKRGIQKFSNQNVQLGPRSDVPYVA